VPTAYGLAVGPRRLSRSVDAATKLPHSMAAVDRTSGGTPILGGAARARCCRLQTDHIADEILLVPVSVRSPVLSPPTALRSFRELGGVEYTNPRRLFHRTPPAGGSLIRPLRVTRGQKTISEIRESETTPSMEIVYHHSAHDHGHNDSSKLEYSRLSI
jgi:hypothetical protein